MLWLVQVVVVVVVVVVAAAAAYVTVLVIIIIKSIIVIDITDPTAAAISITTVPIKLTQSTGTIYS
jgi:hypothetical protein